MKCNDYAPVIEANPPKSAIDECDSDKLNHLVSDVNHDPRELVR